jgi:hypothetical protein
LKELHIEELHNFALYQIILDRSNGGRWDDQDLKDEALQ